MATTIESNPSARWRRRKTARPSEILSAALASFADRGFAATRLDDVAARAGVTKGTLYLYFRNKEELFKAVVRQELVPAIERAETMVTTTPASTSSSDITMMMKKVEVAKAGCSRNSTRQMMNTSIESA